MKVSNQHILVAIITLSLISLPLITLTTGPWRVVLGIFVLLFSPGYSFLSGLFPGKNKLNIIERFALSFGLSCALVVITGLALNYTSWGIRLNPFIIAITCFIVLISPLRV